METTNMEREDRNSFLNFLKGLGCIGVVFIHVMFPGLTGEVISKLSQFAVPVFFMVAGYYALGCSEAVVKRRLKKILKVFIYGYLLFLVYGLVGQLIKGNGIIMEWIKTNYTLKALIKSVIFCNIDFAIPLWYLIAMLETYILWYFVVKYKKEIFFVKWIPVLFLYNLFLTTICETNGFEWFWKINFVAKALPWFLFGYYVHSIGKEQIDKTKNVVLAICAVSGCVVALIPIIFDTTINFSCVGILFYATALFVIAIKYPDIVICKSIAYVGDKLSLNVYIFHVLVAGVIDFAFQLAFHVDTDGNVFLWIKPILTVIATIMFSWMLYNGKQLFIKKRGRKMSQSEQTVGD